MDPIVVLSIAGNVAMEWTKPTMVELEKPQQESVLVERRSLMIMTEDSRYGWMHSITPRKFDIIQNKQGHLTSTERKVRISFTFRWYEKRLY